MYAHVLYGFRLVDDVHVELCTSVYGSYTYKSSITCSLILCSGSKPNLIMLHRPFVHNIHLPIKSRDLNAIDLCSVYDQLAKLS